MSLVEKWQAIQNANSDSYAQNTQNTQKGISANIANIAYRSQSGEITSKEAFLKLLERLECLPGTSLEILSYYPIPTFTLTGNYDGTAYRLFLVAVDAIHEHALQVARIRQ